MYPVYLKVKNFLSFEDQEYAFNNNKAYLIQGINNTKDNQASNGSGKSSVQSAIEYAITKTTSRKCRDVKLVRRGQKSPAYIEFHIFCPIRKETLIITRTIPLKGSTTCECCINSQDNKVPLANVADADDYILNWIDIEKEDLQNYFIVNRERYTSFFTSSNTKKLALVARFSNTSPIDSMIGNVITKVTEKETEISTIQSSVTEKNVEINLLNTQIQNEESRDIKKEKEEQIQKLVKKNKYQSIYSTIKNHYLLNYLDAKISKNKAYLSDLNDEVSKLTEEVQKLENNTLKQSIQSKEKELQTEKLTQVEIDDIKDALNKKVSSINSQIYQINTKLGGSVVCPKCKHEFLPKGDETVEDLNKQKTNYQSNLIKEKQTIEETEEIEQEIKNNINSIKQEVEKLETKEKENKKQIQRININLSSILEHVSDAQLKIKELTNKKKSFESGVQMHDSRIAKNNKQIQSIKEESNTPNTKLFKKQLLKKISNRAVKNIKLQEQQDELFDIKQWEINFKAFKSHLAQKSLLVIQTKINDQLKAMKTDFRVMLEGFKEKADGTLKEEITPLIIDNGEVVEFASLSGGERAMVNFATIIVLQDIVNSTHQYGGLNLLFVDEITEGVDPLVLTNIMKSMPKNKTIFVITHIQMDSMYADVLTIENNFGVSTIKTK